MKRSWTPQWTARLVFVLLIIACIIPLVLQRLGHDSGPSIRITDSMGIVRILSLRDMKNLPLLTRRGSYQNQYGNWRDEGVYAGVLLTDLVGVDYTSIEVVAEDGYRVTIERSRIVDPDYPMILAFRLDGVEVPSWEDGFRIAVLPEDGSVSNVDYQADSAGAYWVMRVSELNLIP